MAESVNFQISGINNQITDDYGSDNDLEVTGGGRGWTATTTKDGRVFSTKASSKLGAAEALYDYFKSGVARPDGDEDDAPDGDEDMTEGEEARCVAECQTSDKDYCECKCGGTNHGMLVPGSASRTVILLGKKLCACGCGQETQRRFVPGHDARFHALEKITERARAAGVSVDEMRAIDATGHKAAARVKAAARRAAKKAQGAELLRRLQETGIVKKQAPAKAARPADDLPF